MTVKHPKEMTDAELCALNEEQIAAAVRRACAEEGVPLVDVAKHNPPVPVPVEGDVTSYKVSGVWHFCSSEDAQKVAALVAGLQQWDVQSRWHKAELLRELVRGRKVESVDVTMSRLLSAEREPMYVGAVEQYEAAQKVYDELLEKNESSASERAAIDKDMRNLIHAARSREKRREVYVNAIAEYMSLADGDYVIARRFFERAYPNILTEFPEMEQHLRPAHDAADYCGCTGEGGKALLRSLCYLHDPALAAQDARLAAELDDATLGDLRGEASELPI